MVMKKKLILLILIFILFIGGIIVLYFLNTSNQNRIREDGLTQEQYQLLVDSLIPTTIEEMNDTRRKNAWLILDVMNDIGFGEHRRPGESRVGGATWILNILGFGELQEVTIVRYQQCYRNMNGYLIMRIISEENNIYYVQYFQSGGLNSVRASSRDGEIVFDRGMHRIRNGQICDIWYPYNCRDGR